MSPVAVDGRRAARLKFYQMVLDEAAKNSWTGETPGLSGKVRRLISVLVLSPDAERQYLSQLVGLITDAANHPGEKADVSSGVLRWIPQAKCLSTER